MHNSTMANNIPFMLLVILASSCISRTTGNQSLINNKLERLKRRIEDLTQIQEKILSQLDSKSLLCSTYMFLILLSL